MKELITIIIPTYNRAQIIEETLLSIQKQTYPNWECIIVDDNSDDKSEEVISKFTKKDSRFSFYRKPAGLMPKGPSASRNYGLKMAKGEYINFFDSDDLMLPFKLERDLEMIKSGDYDFTISQTQFFYPSGDSGKEFWNDKLWSMDPLNDFILLRIGWSTNSPLWKRKSLCEKGLTFDEALITGDDFFFHIEALQKGLTPIISKEITVHQRGEGLRLENFPNKEPFKLKINFSLLQDKRFNLKQETIDILKCQNLRWISGAYKKKNYKTALYFSFEFLKIEKNLSSFREIIRLLLIGTFYKITSKGYSWI